MKKENRATKKLMAINNRYIYLKYLKVWIFYLKGSFFIF